MSTDNLEPLLKDLLEEVKSINRNLIMVLNKKDQDHDHDLNQSDQSDQIRSDLISKNCSNTEKFKLYLDKFEIDYSGLDLNAISRNINYFLGNLANITSKKGYIMRIMKDCPKLRQQPKIYKPMEEEAEDKDSIMGYPPGIVEANSVLLNRQHFHELKPLLSKTEQKLFSTFEKVQDSEMLRNIFTAKAMKAGIIV